MQQQLADLLIKAGCSEAETIVYAELLKTPVRFVYELVSVTGLSKSVVYRAIDGLREKKMIREDGEQMSAASLKKLVADLEASSRKLQHLSTGLKRLSPFLSMPHEGIEEYQHLYDADQIAEAYLGMAGRRDYSVNLDFGDFEGFLPKIGGHYVGNQFRTERLKHATNKAICTTFGPVSAHYCTKDDESIFRSQVKILDIDFKDRFMVLSDTGDHVLFVSTKSDDDLSAVLVKSKMIADMQREQFHIFSQKAGNF